MPKHRDEDFLKYCHNLVVLGGTFDPIHMGHIAIAEAANRQLKPQRVLFIPSGQSPHKLDRQITCAKHRYNMTALAICQHPAFDISRLEIDRQGPSYTIDTARTLHAICPAGAKISFLIGYDALAKILSWKDAEELLKTCEFIAVPRPGYEMDDGVLDYLTQKYNTHIHKLDGPLLDISSTDVRARLRNGQAVSNLVPNIVENYAVQHSLYAPNHQASQFCFETAKEELRVRLSPKRFNHTMGVVAEAKKLAIHYNQDIEKACNAALLHDCAKEYSTSKKRTLCQVWGVQLDAALEADIELTHSLLGAESANRDFHIHDSETLQAIRYHTTGHSHMSMLDKIIMLADYIEPSRANWGHIEEMRQLAKTNINKALILRINSIMKKENQSNRPIHPWSLDALKSLAAAQSVAPPH